MFENEEKIALEQYRLYSDLLRQTTLQRSISNYFFITINIFIIYVGYFNATISKQNLNFFATLSLIAVLLCIYWSQEVRELYILNEVRFRILMETEKKLVQFGLLSEEWERLGDFRFRRSPILFVSLSRYLPFIFLMIHIVVFLIVYYTMLRY